MSPRRSASPDAMKGAITLAPSDTSRRWGAWARAALLLLALVVAAPIAAVFIGALAPAEAQGHVWSVNGGRYLATTLVLCLMVAAGATLLGAGSALLIALTDFPGRRALSVALALPFAIPAYVAAYAYADFFGPFGPVATLIGPGAARAGVLPEIRSLPGAAFVLALASYPYVYLAMRASLSARSGAYLEAARSLGASPLSASLRVLLAAGRPALIGGLALALMETAADYGVADYFGVQTLSVGIFRTWYGLGDLTAATQLAAGLFLAALLLVLMEEAGRRGAASEPPRAHRARTRLRLSPGGAALAITACAVPVVLGFAIPAGVLVAKLDLALSAGAARGLGAAAVNTGGVAALGAGAATLIALVLAYAGRAAGGGGSALLLRIATFGYAIPGAVIAIGVLALATGAGAATRALGAGWAASGAAGGVFILLYAYVARFLTAGYNTAAGGLAQIHPQTDAAAKSLGAGGTRIVLSLHWPLARGAVLAGAAIIAIDIAKELPATLLLRPFNFETLSTHIYRLASDERLADAAPAALILIGVSLIPAALLSLAGEPQRNRRAPAGAAAGAK